MIRTPNGHVIGERVATEKMCRLTNENKLHEAFYPKIEVNGKMVYLRDLSYEGGIKHAPTRKEARKLAIETREKIIAGLEKGE